MPMQFTSARPDAVRAINQRWLLKFWMQHLNGGQTPRWQTVEPNDLESIADNLSLLDVTADTPPRYMIRFHGRLIARAHGTTDCRGRCLDEVVPAARRADAVAPYAQSVRNGAPVYTIQDLNDSGGRLVHFERLLLPFSRDGKTVDRILGAYELVCADGDFDARELMSAAGCTPVTRLSATIDVPAMA